MVVEAGFDKAVATTEVAPQAVPDVAAPQAGDAFAGGPVPAVTDEGGAAAEASASTADTLALLRELDPTASDEELAAVEARLRARGFLPRRITPAFRAELDARRAKFMAESSIGAGELTAMPEGDLRHREAFEGTLAFLNDKARVFQRLQELEIEVSGRAAASGASKEQVLIEVMADIEARNGFKPAIDLPAQVLDGPAWSAMLRGGALFNDTTFSDADRGGNTHAKYTHRLQWTVLMMEMAANPAAFADADGQVASPADMFVETGRKRDSKLNWSKTGINTKVAANKKLLWFALFDAWDDAFTGPEAMRKTHDYWPGVGKWE
ncbi:MAG: LirA/MavJ family T4SS effector [Kofleriaceae bacterium]